MDDMTLVALGRYFVLMAVEREKMLRDLQQLEVKVKAAETPEGEKK